MEINLIDMNTPDQKPKTDEKLLIRDLKLSVLLDIMAKGDPELLRICTRIILQPSSEKEEIQKRQSVLKDGMNHPEMFHTIYRCAVQALDRMKAFEDTAKQKYSYIVSVPKKILTQAEITSAALDHLKTICACIRQAQNISSTPLSVFFREFTNYYNDGFLEEIKNLLQTLTILKKTDAVTMGGHLGKGLKMTDMTLHRISAEDASPEERKGFLPLIRKLAHVYEIKIENTTIENEVREIIDGSLTRILKAISNFNYSAKSLLEQLKFQFGFYCGGLNLYRCLSDRKIEVCFPEFIHTHKVLNVSGLSDLFLVIKEGAVVTNSIFAEGKSNWVITGVNQGGKTTFLRSLGTAQLLAQCGYFTPAGQYTCNIYQGIFTHFPEEEDTTLNHGLLEQELLKLNDIITKASQGSMLLLNETFATTTEYDAAYLAGELFEGFSESNITTFYVTHNYEFSHALYWKNKPENIFLRAERESDGTRIFRLQEGEPRKTGYAIDLYNAIINT